MNRTRTITTLLAALAIAVALTAAGCGSDDSSGGSAYGGGGTGTAGGEATTTAKATGSRPAMLKVANASGVGAVLVDADGFTVYDFHKDQGTKSSCYGGCEKVWPPLTTGGAPETGEGAMASKLGTTRRKDGTVQVTYAGHPLYTFAEDKKPGEANGNDLDFFGGEWYALQASGADAEG